MPGVRQRRGGISGQLRDEVSASLTGRGFVEIAEGRTARNENKYLASRWQYSPRYPHDVSLHPYLSLELAACASASCNGFKPL